jgi:hypothetical protein
MALTDYEKVQDSLPFIGNDIAGCRMGDLWRVCKSNRATETHVRREDNCHALDDASLRKAPVRVEACRSACASADESCEVTTVLPAITKSARVDHHTLSLTSSQSNLGPLALAETFQVTLVYIMQLGFWKGLIGGLAVFLILVSATIGCILSIGLWLRRKEDHPRKRTRRRESAQAREFRFPTKRQSSRKRVRWLDKVEGGHELEKAMGYKM